MACACNRQTCKNWYRAFASYQSDNIANAKALCWIVKGAVSLMLPFIMRMLIILII
jgi:hypothetical protein